MSHKGRIGFHFTTVGDWHLIVFGGKFSWSGYMHVLNGYFNIHRNNYELIKKNMSAISCIKSVELKKKIFVFKDVFKRVSKEISGQRSRSGWKRHEKDSSVLTEKNGRKNKVIPLTGIDSIRGIESGTDKINYINHLTFSLCTLPVQQSGTNWAATECAQRSSWLTSGRRAGQIVTARTLTCTVDPSLR